MQCLPKYYILRNARVCPHQRNHCVKTFCALLRNNLYRIFKRCVSSKCLIVSNVWCFYRSSFFLNFIYRPYITVTTWSSCWGVDLVHASHQYGFCVETKTFGVLRGASAFLYFHVFLPSPPTCRPRVQAKHAKSKIYNW